MSHRPHGGLGLRHGLGAGPGAAAQEARDGGAPRASCQPPPAGDVRTSRPVRRGAAWPPPGPDPGARWPVSPAGPPGAARGAAPAGAPAAPAPAGLSVVASRLRLMGTSHYRPSTLTDNRSFRPRPRSCGDGRVASCVARPRLAGKAHRPRLPRAPGAPGLRRGRCSAPGSRSRAPWRPPRHPGTRRRTVPGPPCTEGPRCCTPPGSPPGWGRLSLPPGWGRPSLPPGWGRAPRMPPRIPRIFPVLVRTLTRTPPGPLLRRWCRAGTSVHPLSSWSSCSNAVSHSSDKRWALHVIGTA